MLSLDQHPPRSFKIGRSNEECALRSKDESSDRSAIPQSSHFSIRNYVESSRSKDIGNHWPFSQQYLDLCLNHGLKNLLPPFEPMKSGNKIENIESEADKCKENSSPISIMLSDLISPKTCPVCKSFSSSSNTTLNAHIDQCLLDGAEIGRTTVKINAKRKKKRSMAEILDSAPVSTIEDLDRRNGTNWAVDLGLIRVSREVGVSAGSSGANSGVLSERRIEDWRGRSSRSAKRRKKLEREMTPEKAMAEVKIKDAESLNSSKRETPSISSVLLDAEHDDLHVHVHDQHHHDDALLEVSSTKAKSSIQETEDDHPRRRITEDNPRDFDLNSEFLSLDEPPVLEKTASFKKSSVIRLMGKNLVVMHHEDEERESELEKREERETFSWVLPSRKKFQTGIEAWRYRLLPPAM